MRFRQFFEYTFFDVPESPAHAPVALLTGERHIYRVTFVYGPDDRILDRHEAR
jgi:hypothetical protein